MLVSVPQSIGLPALFALVFGESAGLPIPGETALIVSGGLASDGQMSLPAVILVGAIAAICGDMIGYWIGRRGGRKLLLREGRFSAHRRSAVEKADKYFDRYGVITVFFARFVPGVRVVGALAAGATEMRWRNFAIANALGCFTWAATVASIAYAVGPEGAIVMVIVGFSIAGIGLFSAWWGTRRSGGLAEAPADEAHASVVATADEAPASAHDPLVALSGSLGETTAPVATAARTRKPTEPGQPAPARLRKPAEGAAALPAAPKLAACANRTP